MTVEETRRHIQRAFESVGSVNKFQYLQGHKDNTLKVSKKQELDGCGVINLAGCGSLCLHQMNDEPTTEASSSNAGSKVQQMLRKADELLKELRVSQFLSSSCILCMLQYYCNKHQFGLAELYVYMHTTHLLVSRPLLNQDHHLIVL